MHPQNEPSLQNDVLPSNLNVKEVIEMPHWTQTPKGKETMRNIMKARHARKDPTLSNGGRRKRVPPESFLESAAEPIVMDRKPPHRASKKPYGRTVYALSDQVRTAIESHVRNGGRLEPLHTVMLALTDHLMEKTPE